MIPVALMGRIRRGVLRSVLVATPLILALVPAGVAEAGKSRKPAVASHMPHPERHALPTQHPRWTRVGLADEGDGLRLFRNAVKL